MAALPPQKLMMVLWEGLSDIYLPVAARVARAVPSD